MIIKRCLFKATLSQGRENMSIKDVILLGAGASKSDGAPLQNELFKEFLKYYQDVLKGKLWTLPHKQEKLIINFFEDFWGINIDDYHGHEINFPTFEECLGILDLAYLRRESLKGYTQEKINRTRNALIFLIAKILDERLKTGTTIYHKQLVDRLKEEGRMKETAFINLNYDIIFDNVLTELYPEFRLDYGIEFVNFDRPHDWERPDKNPILLLKMHGSLNWLYCPTCTHIELTPLEKGAVKAFYEIKKCQSCKTPMKPVIIPPTFYKEISNPFIQQIFLKTDKTLRNVERLFICGYSFPDADTHIKYLLKRAERYQGKTPEIFVINNLGSKTLKERKMENLRFTRFFKNKEKIHCTKLSFEEFSKNGIDDQFL